MISASPQAAEAFMVRQRDAMEAGIHAPDYASAMDLKWALENKDDPEAQEILENHEFTSREGVSGNVLLKTLEALIPERDEKGKSFGTLNSAMPQAIGVRVLTLLHMLQSSRCELGAISMNEIAKKTGLSRAIYCHWAKHFERIWGIHSRGMKGVEASKIYKQTAKEGWETRRKNKQTSSKDSYLTKLKQHIKELRICKSN
jgi:hypothetical protein